MPFERPTLTQIIDRVTADAESRLGKRTMRWSLPGVISRVVAAVSHNLYGYAAFIMRQTFTTTAEAGYLERRASEYGIYRKEATKATGTVTFVGAGIVPQGTQLIAGNDVVYITTSPSDQNVASIEAVEAGASGNSEEGLELTLVSPIAGIQSTATASVLAGGTDAEDDESLRARLLMRQRNPPRAGTKADYVEWALEVPGVTRAWCYPQELGLGWVTVRFMTDTLTDDGIPTTDMVERVQEYIESQMPVTAMLQVVAPVAKPLDITVDVLPDTETIRANVEAALESAILSESEPGGVILRTTLDRAMATVSGITSYRLVSPTDDVAAGVGNILVPGTVTFE